jgi:P27 family predicted phage terminase small subunit
MNPNEPKLPVEAPLMPKHLTTEVRQEWRRVTKSLSDMGILSRHDGPAIEMYCDAYSTMVKAQEGIKASGLLIKGGNGAPKANPLIAIANEAQRNALKILVEFGLTPAARSRVSVNAPQEQKASTDRFFRER